MKSKKVKKYFNNYESNKECKKILKQFMKSKIKKNKKILSILKLSKISIENDKITIIFNLNKYLKNKKLSLINRK